MNAKSNPRESLAYSLHRLSFILQRISDDNLQANFGLGYSQFKLMIGIKHNPGCEQRELAKFVGLTEAGISRQLRLMHKSGLVTIGVDKKDSRRRQVELSTKGTKLLTDAKKHLEAVHRDLFSSLSDADSEHLIKLTNHMFDLVKTRCLKTKA